MIVFISDLHMSDNTAGPPNTPPQAFKGAFQELEQTAVDAGAKEVTLVFLGDMFDLIRTTAWQKYPLASRPWGDPANDPKNPPAGLEEAALDALGEVVKAEKNAESFGYLRDAFGKIPSVKRVYVPGNHDRPCNMFPSMRQETARILGLDWPDKNVPFANYFVDEKHRCFARHGHEWDAFNFEGAPLGHGDLFFDPLDYYKTPIGDVLAAEFSSTIPDAVVKQLGYKPQEFYDRLKNLFDLRPNSGMIEYLEFQVKQFDENGRLENAVNAAVRDLAETFQSMPFVKAWMKQHFHLFNVLTPATELTAMFDVLRHAPFADVARLFSALGAVADHFHFGDNFLSMAAADIQRLDATAQYKGKIDYVLYGHTHDPDQEVISVTGTPPNERQCVYLNTGMWRPLSNKGAVSGFVLWKNLTHTTIFLPEESGDQQFEVWTGALKENDSLP